MPIYSKIKQTTAVKVTCIFIQTYNASHWLGSKNPHNYFYTAKMAFSLHSLNSDSPYATWQITFEAEEAVCAVIWRAAVHSQNQKSH